MMWSMKKLRAIPLLVLLTLAGGAGIPAHAEEATAAKPELTLYLVRHGQTLFNVKSIVSGWSDSPLTAKGVKQATGAGEALKDIAFNSAYTSDLGRAHTTAELILEKNAKKTELTPIKDIREENYGGFDGDSDESLWTPIFKEYGFKFDPSWSNWEEFQNATTEKQRADAVAHNDKMGLAETWDQYNARLQRGIDEIVKEALAKGGGDVLVVSHGGAIAAMLELMDPEGYKGEDIGNASISTVTYGSGKFKVAAVGQKTLK